MTAHLPRQTMRFNDVRPHNTRLAAEIDAAIQAVVADGRFELGKEVDEFERAFAGYIGVRHAVGVHSGTAALHLALRALGVGPDEVITVANSDPSTVAAIRFAGARPVLVDIEPHSFNMDPAALAAAVTPRTRAVLPVHMYGRPAEMTPILEVARRHHLLVVEDAALAAGAIYRDRQAGAWGDAACFSFAPGKVLGAFGWGGMITTGDGEVARRIKMLRAYGEDPATHPPPSAGFRFATLHPEVQGWNVRLDTLQAAVLLVKLPHLDSMVEERQAIAERYREGLRGTHAAIADDPPYLRNAYRNFVIRVKHRDTVRRLLFEAGIPTGTHYIPPTHLQPAFQDLGYPKGSLPETERAADELLTLPIYPGMPIDDVDLVIEQLRRAMSTGL
ncbi:MAG: DegT/DnrJ/EryC1/StrS family aminotransferase [Armatimonadota bacterium]